MKLYLQLGLCIALSLLGTVLSGPLAMEYEPEKFTIQSSNPMEYNDEPDRFTIQSHNPLESNDKPSIQSSNPMEYSDELERFTIQSSNPMEYNDEPERFTIQSHNPLESNDKPSIQSSNPMEYSDELERLTIESSILDSGRPITFKCLFAAFHTNPNLLYLDGLTVSGGVNLAPSTTCPYTGTRWLPIRLADGSYAFKCLGHIHNPNHLYLNGLTVSRGVNLAPNTTGPYTGTHWRAIRLSDRNTYVLQCLGHIHNPLDLHGNTYSGDVNLASPPSALSVRYGGTRWKIEYA